MNLICISCELFISLKSTSFVLHGYNIPTSSVLPYKVHMNFIRTAGKIVWINLTAFIWNSWEVHLKSDVKFIWTSHEFHMNKFDLIPYEIHEKFMWTSYEVHMKFTINCYAVQTNFMWSYAYMVFIWSIVPTSVNILSSLITTFTARFGHKTVLICRDRLCLPWIDGASNGAGVV